MKHEPCIILKLLLNFSTFEPQYSYKQYCYKKCNKYCTDNAKVDLQRVLELEYRKTLSFDET